MKRVPFLLVLFKVNKFSNNKGPSKVEHHEHAHNFKNYADFYYEKNIEIRHAVTESLFIF